jgi:hypothetical protein
MRRVHNGKGLKMGFVNGVAGRVRTFTALFAGLLAIAPASALGVTQVIPGNGLGPAGHNLTIYIGDEGRLQAKSAPAFSNTQGMFYGEDHGPASQYHHLRFKGEPAPNTTITNSFVPVSNGPVMGNGTPASPFQNVTVTKAQVSGADIFQIRQTVLYVPFEQRFRVVWDITNIDALNRTIPFIWGTSADLYIDSSDSGTGVFIDGPNRFLGGTNSLSRTTGGIQEVTSSALPGESTPLAIPRWASYQEGPYSFVTSRLISNDAFPNTIEQNLVDNGVGVSFDNRAVAGLGPGQTQRYEVVWYAKRPTPLSASPASAADEVPGHHDVTLTLVDALFNPLPGQRINYEIAGANPSSGQAVTGPTGQVVVGWDGNAPGLDTLNAYVDANGNGVRDGEEPAASAKMNWLADNHVDGPPQVPPNLNGPNGQVEVQVQPNPENPEAPNFIFGRSATAAAGFGDCEFDERAGRELNLPVTVNLQPGASTISEVKLAVTDPSRHNPADTGSSLPSAAYADTAPSSSGNSFSFVVKCVVNGEMWVEFKLTEGAVTQTFRIPIGGLALIDPQGVVYDGARYDQAIAGGQSPERARATAAIKGATVRLQRLVNGSFFSVLSGDPGIIPHVNPQTTAANGIYQWDVQTGTYRVTVTASGCQDAVSPSVDIPPPVLDLHVRMACASGSTPPKAKPSNAFSIRKKLKGSKSGTKVTLEVIVPGPGEVSATDATPVPKKAKGKKGKASKKAKAAGLFGPVRKSAKGAETVKLTLKLTKAGKAKLKKAGKVIATALVSYTPTGGDKATQKINVKFKKFAKKAGKRRGGGKR